MQKSTIIYDPPPPSIKNDPADALKTIAILVSELKSTPERRLAIAKIEEAIKLLRMPE
jgi:hypothetical protein